MKLAIVVQRPLNARHTIRCPTIKSLISAPDPTNHGEIFRGSASTPSSYPCAGMPLRANGDNPLGITVSVIRPLRDDWFFFWSWARSRSGIRGAVASAISEPISAHPTDRPPNSSEKNFFYEGIRKMLQWALRFTVPTRVHGSRLFWHRTLMVVSSKSITQRSRDCQTYSHPSNENNL